MKISPVAGSLFHEKEQARLLESGWLVEHTDDYALRGVDRMVRRRIEEAMAEFVAVNVKKSAPATV